MTVRDVQHPARLTWPGFPGVPDDAIDRLMGPGTPFEMELEQVGQRRLDVFVRRPRSLRQMLDETVASRPDLPFLVAPDRSWTFSEGQAEIDAIAALLADEYAIGRGDRVAIVAANSPEYGLVMWATLSLGAVVSSLNGWWTAPELEHGIELSSPKLIAGDAPRLARLEDAAVPPHVPVRRLDELRAAAMARPATSHAPSAEVVEDDPAVILFTSGTTGRAKGATLSHRNIINFVMTGKLGTALGEMFVPATAGAQPATLLASPMFHVSGMLGIFMSGGGLGAKLVFPPPGRWDPTAYLELTERHGISTWSGVPTQFWRLLRHEHLDDYDLRCVTTVGSGGAPFPPELVRALTERMPWATLSNGYGMSETVGIGTRVVGPTMVAHPDSVGPANIGTEVEIRDVGGGPVLSEGEVGEIYLRSPSVFLGYWDNQAATSACLDAEGWYRTGDFGRIQDGMLYLDSRMRDMVLRGGENIYPIEIEHRLVEHPEIDDAAVIGVDHPELGQEVKAFVVRSPGSDPHASGRCKEWAARSLAAFKVPAHVEFRTEPAVHRDRQGPEARARAGRALAGDDEASHDDARAGALHPQARDVDRRPRGRGQPHADRRRLAGLRPRAHRDRRRRDRRDAHHAPARAGGGGDDPPRGDRHRPPGRAGRAGGDGDHAHRLEAAGDRGGALPPRRDDRARPRRVRPPRRARDARRERLAVAGRGRRHRRAALRPDRRRGRRRRRPGAARTAPVQPRGGAAGWGDGRPPGGGRRRRSVAAGGAGSPRRR